MSSKKPIKEGDVQSWAEGQSIKNVHPNAEIHLDHIPSKQAIKEAYTIINLSILRKKNVK
jgi:hypothetical protein